MAGDTSDSTIDLGGVNEQSDKPTSPEFSFGRSFTPEQLRQNDNLSMMVAPSMKRPEESHIAPVFIFTAIFGAIFIIAPLLVRQGPNRSVTRVCIMLSTVCCWIFWTTTYIVQMNPLLGPRMSNHSLAWVGHKWGHDAAALTAAANNNNRLNALNKVAMFNERTKQNDFNSPANEPNSDTGSNEKDNTVDDTTESTTSIDPLDGGGP